MSRYILAAALVVGLSMPALADRGFYIIRGADRDCKVVDVPPNATQTTFTRIGTRVGNNIYTTQAEAQADMARICEGDTKEVFPEGD